jgi:hypothetical protein
MARVKFASPNFSNLKDGNVMPARKLTTEELREVSRVAKAVGI